MIIVAGLPQSVLNRAVSAFRNRFPETIVIGSPAKTNDGALYPAVYTDSLIRAVCEFSRRRRSNGPTQPTPASISLYFVPSADQENLLTAFDFFVMPVPLKTLSDWSARGKQFRHDPELCEQAIIAAHQPSAAGRLALNEVVRRVAFESDNEAMLLPPINFLTADGNLEAVYREFRSQDRNWSDRLADLGPSELSHDDVPKRIASNQTRRPFIDSRGMAYCIAHRSAYDGHVWETDEGSDIVAFKMALRSLYRFGASIPQGLHHDVQRSDGCDLGGADFHCSTKGLISSNDGYANIYPNDFVRVKSYESQQG